MPVSGAMPRQAAKKANQAIRLSLAMHHTRLERIAIAIAWTNWYL